MLKNDLILQHKNVTLTVLQPSDFEPLSELAKDDNIWKVYRLNYQQEQQFKTHWFDKAIKQMQSGKRIAFLIKLNNEVAGSTSFYDVDPENKALWLGYTWYHSNFWGSNLNKITKYLLLEFAFDTFKYNRIGFHIDIENTRSCKAVESLGAKKEGILRQNMIRVDGSLRDTVCYSILCSEWPEIKKILEAKIA